MKRLAKLFVLGFIACSCVNEAYDLNKVDGTAVIMKDVAMPIGSVDPIKINDIMSFDESSMIAKDPDGNLFFQFRSSESINESITIPQFTIPFSSQINDTGHTLKFDTGSYAGMDGTQIESYIISLQQDFQKSIKIDAQLPSEVVDAEYVNLEVALKYIFEVNTGAAYVKEGFKLDFPDWMTVVKTDDNTAYLLENEGNNKNVAIFKSNTKVAQNAPLEINLMITRVDFPEGCLVDGKVTLDETDEANMIKVNGNIYMDTKDFPTIPPSLEVSMNIEFSDFDVKSARLSLDMDMAFGGQEINLPEYPEFFKSEGFVLDIHDLFLNFNIKNTLPLGLELDADFEAYKNSAKIRSMHIGANPKNSEDGTTAVLIPADTEDTKIVFSKLGKEGTIALPMIGDLLADQPDMIKVSDVVISSARDYVEIIPGTTYDCSLGYELLAPLAFGKKFSLKYDLGLSDLAMDLSEYGISNASLTMTVTNGIPLNFSLSAKALDADGQPVEGLDMDVVGNIASGVHNDPSTSVVELRLKSTGKSVNFNSLALTLIATAPADIHLGTALNENQGLEIKGISLRLPDGVTVDVNSIFSADPSQEKANE